MLRRTLGVGAVLALILLGTACPRTSTATWSGSLGSGQEALDLRLHGTGRHPHADRRHTRGPGQGRPALHAAGDRGGQPRATQAGLDARVLHTAGHAGQPLPGRQPTRAARGLRHAGLRPQPGRDRGHHLQPFRCDGALPQPFQPDAHAVGRRLQHRSRPGGLAPARLHHRLHLLSGPADRYPRPAVRAVRRLTGPDRPGPSSSSRCAEADAPLAARQLRLLHLEPGALPRGAGRRR